MKVIQLSLLLLVFPLIMAASLPTSLKLTVLDDLGNAVEAATVSLFENEADYNKNENPIGTFTTDAKGKIIIKEIKPQLYYVNVEKGDLNNNQTGVQVGPIIAGKINKATIIIQE